MSRTPGQQRTALLEAADALTRADYELGCALTWTERTDRVELCVEVDAMFKRCIEIRESLYGECGQR